MKTNVTPCNNNDCSVLTFKHTRTHTPSHTHTHTHTLTLITPFLTRSSSASLIITGLRSSRAYTLAAAALACVTCVCNIDICIYRFISFLVLF